MCMGLTAGAGIVEGESARGVLETVELSVRVRAPSGAQVLLRCVAQPAEPGERWRGRGATKC